jgi:hypothetical protein
MRRWRILLKCILKIGWDSVDWIKLAQDGGRWQGFFKQENEI